MAKTVTLDQANEYFDTYVLHSEPWDETDDKRKQKALNNAEVILYRYFDYYNIDDNTKQIPYQAVCEQALWLLRQEEAVLRAEMGIIQVSVKGISILTDGKGAKDYIAPEAGRIIEERENQNGGDGGGRRSRKIAWTVI